MKKTIKFFVTSACIFLNFSALQAITGFERTTPSLNLNESCRISQRSLHEAKVKEGENLLKSLKNPCTYAEQEEIVANIAMFYIPGRVIILESMRKACANYLKYGRCDQYDAVVYGSLLAPRLRDNIQLRSIFCVFQKYLESAE